MKIASATVLLAFIALPGTAQTSSQEELESRWALAFDRVLGGHALSGSYIDPTIFETGSDLGLTLNIDSGTYAGSSSGLPAVSDFTLLDGRWASGIEFATSSRRMAFLERTMLLGRAETGDPGYMLPADTDGDSIQTQQYFIDEFDRLGIRFSLATGIVAPGGVEVSLDSSFDTEVTIDTGVAFQPGTTIDVSIDWEGVAEGVFPVLGGFSVSTQLVLIGNPNTEIETFDFDNQFASISLFSGVPIDFGFGTLYTPAIEIPSEGAWRFTGEFDRTIEVETFEGENGNGWFTIETFFAQGIGMDNFNETDPATQFGSAFVDGFNTFTFDVTFDAPGATAVVPPNCNEADLAQPFGTLDFNDIEAFVVAFLGGSGAADLNNDFFNDFNDIERFVTAFLAGCP